MYKYKIGVNKSHHIQTKGPIDNSMASLSLGNFTLPEINRVVDLAQKIKAAKPWSCQYLDP